MLFCIWPAWVYQVRETWFISSMTDLFYNSLQAVRSCSANCIERTNVWMIKVKQKKQAEDFIQRLKRRQGSACRTKQFGECARLAFSDSIASEFAS